MYGHGRGTYPRNNQASLWAYTSAALPQVGKARLLYDSQPLMQIESLPGGSCLRSLHAYLACVLPNLRRQHWSSQRARKNTQTHTHTHIYEYIYVYMQTYFYVYTFIYKNLYVYTSIHPPIHPSIHPPMHTYIHTQTHTRTHTQTYVYIYILYSHTMYSHTYAYLCGHMSMPTYLRAIMNGNINPNVVEKQSQAYM